MKTRIISGIVMALIVATVLVFGFLSEPFIITVAVALLATAAIYELLHNAAGIKDKLCWIGAAIFAFLFVTIGNGNIDKPYNSFPLVSFLTTTVVLLYFLFAVIMILKNNKEFDLGKIAALFGIPLPFAYAFFCLASVIRQPDGLYYLLLLLNFSSVCDMGAYFVGVTIGKHKLCPNLSPKKTVEGAIGGIVSSVVFTLVISLLFDKLNLAVMLLTIPFCILGMIGDLFASAIKRAVGLKDYSNLIPGHGGIMDRLDSIIMIVPFLYFVVVTVGVI